MEKPREKECLRRVLEGDTEAFALLVRQYTPKVFPLVYRLCGSRETAEELTQDTFMKAYTHLASFSGKSSFSTWLYRIAYNTAMSHVRKKRANEAPSENDGAHIPDRQAFYGDENEAMANERKTEILEKSLNLLTAGERNMVLLHYKEKVPLKDIAAIMSMSEGNAKVKLHRTRKKLMELCLSIEKEYER